MKTFKASAAYLLALALFFPTLAAAQTEGRFIGVVLDQTGAVVELGSERSRLGSPPSWPNGRGWRARSTTPCCKASRESP